MRGVLTSVRYCMLDPIPYKLLKKVLPEVIDPLLNIINLSM